MSVEREIRMARADERDAVAELFDAYRRFYEQPGDPDGARRFVGERLERGDSVILVAEADDGALDGFTQLYPTLSSVSMGKLFVLNDLFVRPGARRGGVARALLGAAHEHARAAGAIRVGLATAVDNHAAQRLYESMGYARTEGFHHYDLVLAP